MGILYLKEHTSCYNYAKCIREGFLYYESLKIETDEEIAKELQDRGEKFMTGKMKETGKTTNSGTEKSLP